MKKLLPILAVLAVITVIQRFLDVHRQLAGTAGPTPGRQ